MASTGEARRWELAALIAAVACIVAIVLTGLGSIATAEDRPPCEGGNFVGGTCRPDDSGSH